MVGFYSKAVRVLVIGALCTSTYGQVAMESPERKLAVDYVSWTTPKSSADGDNPFRKAALACGESIVDELIRAANSGYQKWNAIYLLGEIGSRRGFPFLFSEYLIRADARIATSLGSSLGPAEIDYLFANELLADKPLRELLSNVLRDDWNALKDQPLSDIRVFLHNKLPTIRQSCMKRSVPVSG